MAFKKSAAKKQKKSKKSSKNKDREWKFDGGQNTEELQKQAEMALEKRKRRDTQNRDENLRRSKAKLQERKQKQVAEKKMKRKISFLDYAGLSSKPEPKEEVHKRPKFDSSYRNPHSIEERLRQMAMKNLQNDLSKAKEDHYDIESTTYNSDSDCSHDSENGEEVINDAGSETASVEDTDVNGLQHAHTSISQLTTNQEEKDDIEVEDILEVKTIEAGPSSSSFKWYFSSDDSDAAPPSKLSPVTSLDASLELLAALHPTIEAASSSSISTLKDIPHAPKLWGSAPLSKYSRTLLPYLTNYTDALLEGRNHTNDREYMHSVMSHITAHALHTRTIVMRHNQKLKQKAMQEKRGGKTPSGTAEELPASYCDQGFTRPRILILCPFRSSAYEVIQVLLELLGETSTASNLSKLQEEFGMSEEDAADVAELNARKPMDWQALFQNNTDDDFKFGIQLNPGHGKGSGASRGVYARLFSEFYASDIIVASPLGLRLVVEAKAKLSFDFLSSIEMVFMHQADVLLMQNWDHVTYVMNQINQMPKDGHEVDFSRVRPYFLEGQAAHRRQLIITSQYNDPQIQSLFRQYAQSRAGSIRLKQRHTDGCLSMVAARVQQMYQLLSCDDPVSQEDVRFAFFKDNILPQFLRNSQKRTLIVTPSYFSYVRLRNELMRQEVNAAYVCEYSRESEISRGRSRFFHGQKDVLLYSGRAHFFR